MRRAFATLAFALAAAALPLSGQVALQVAPGEDLFRGETHAIKRLELRSAKVVDAIRLIAEISGLNVVSTEEAGNRDVTLYLQGVTAGNAVETLCKVAGLWYRRDDATQTFRIMTTGEFQKDHIIYRKDEIQVFTLLHPNSIVIATAIEDLFGARVDLSLGVDEELAIDLPAGFSLGRSGAGFGDLGLGLDGGAGSLGGGGFLGGATQRDQFLRRSTGSGLHRGIGGRAGGSERVLEEDLTPDQIERLQELAPEGLATGEELRGVTREDPTIYVTVNRQHNLIVVRTSDTEAMTEIERLIAELDRPTPQVLLEMKILSLDIGDGFRSVFDLEHTGGPSTSGPETAGVVNPLLPGADTAPRSVLGSGNFDLEASTFVYQFLNDNVRARIQLLETENRVEVLSTPLLLASNNRPARIFVGQEAVLTTGVNTDVITSATGPVTQVITPITEVRPVGQTLVVVPKINADRTVTLFLLQDNSTILPNGSTIPVATDGGGVEEVPIDTVQTANLQVTVVAKDGMTLAVGGLIDERTSDVEEKVPVLGDLPLLGFFFKKKEKIRDRRELVLLIRPRVLFTPAEANEATQARIKGVSIHPYVTEGEGAYHAKQDQVFERILPEGADQDR